MITKSIEVEIRAELSKQDLIRVEKRLRSIGFKFVSTTRRTSVMSFGITSAKGRGWNHHKSEDVDIRCRITNGRAEVVVKTGEAHIANRLELSTPVTIEQFYPFARMTASTGLFTKVGSKITKNYQKGLLTASIVQSRSGITYLEIEMMSNRKNEEKALKRLYALADHLGVQIIRSRKAFLELCERLTKIDDWGFRGTRTDLARLRKEIARVGSGKK